MALVTNDALLNGVGEETEGQKSPMGELFSAALASGPSDKSTRYDIVNYLLQVMANGQDEASKSKEYYRLENKAEKYKRLQPIHRSLLKEGEIIGSVFVMRQSSGMWVNYDEVYGAAFKKAPNAIILVEREGGYECRECGAGFRRPSRYGDCPRCHADNYTSATNYNTLVATSTELNLPNIFKVTGRMAHRVTLYGDKLQEALKTLNELAEKAGPPAEPAPQPEATRDTEGEARAGQIEEPAPAEAEPIAQVEA